MLKRLFYQILIRHLLIEGAFFNAKSKMEVRQYGKKENTYIKR